MAKVIVELPAEKCDIHHLKNGEMFWAETTQIMLNKDPGRKIFIKNNDFQAVDLTDGRMYAPSNLIRIQRIPKKTTIKLEQE